VVLAAMAIWSCGGSSDLNEPQLLTVDPMLSLQGVLGGDFALAVAFDTCATLTGPATAEANGVVLGSLDTPEVLVFGVGKRFLITVTGTAIDQQRYGVPANVPIVVHAVCDGKRSRSNTYTVEYVPVLSTIVAPTTVPRFWPADSAGEILGCSGNSLVHYDASGNQIGDALNLGFACALGEMHGDVGGRRFLTVNSDGIAAIDPGPVLLWTRHSNTFLFLGMWASPTEDIVVVYRTSPVSFGSTAFVALVDRNTGLDKFPAIVTTYKTLPPVTRNPDGNIGVLTWNKEGVENVYYTEFYDTTGAALRGPLQVASYPSGMTPYAEFSFDGTRIYASGTDGGAGFWIQMSTLVEGTLTQLTGPSDGWKNVVGEAFGRLLVSSDDHFVWLAPDTASVDSSPFAPDSGNSFFRVRVEADGSTIMLADPNSNAGADGFYVFAPDGADVIRLHQNQHFSWLTESVGGGSLIGIQDGSGDIQEVTSGHGFETGHP
jgi:hypothetical protein